MTAKRTTILQRSDHTVSRQFIDRDALQVMHRLNRNGYKAYLVGGSVRDLLLGRIPKDFDISTDAEPSDIKRLFRNCFLVGRRFRLAHIRFGRHKVIETSTFRKQPTTNESADNLVQWDDNQFGTPEEDAFRRDFTINALFYDLHDFCVIDHVGGLADLRKQLVRTIGDPNIRFREDPVRMIRAVRFAGRLGFRLETRTRRAIIKHADEILLAAPARLLEEMYKLFGMSASEPSFRLLWQLDIMHVLMPELCNYIKDTGGRKSPLWRVLTALDQGGLFEGTAHHALLLSTLFQGPMVSACADLHTLHDVNVACANWLEPIATRFRMPRGVRYRVLRLVENQIRFLQLQERFVSGRKSKSILRFVAHPSFAESLALLKLRAAAGLVAPEAVSFWEDMAKKHGGELSVSTCRDKVEGGETVPRRRRRRRRRKRSHEA